MTPAHFIITAALMFGTGFGGMLLGMWYAYGRSHEIIGELDNEVRDLHIDLAARPLRQEHGRACVHGGLPHSGECYGGGELLGKKVDLEPFPAECAILQAVLTPGFDTSISAYTREMAARVDAIIADFSRPKAIEP